MCGIVGAISERDIVEILMEGLRRLEYRGYDSAGVAVIDEKEQLQRRRIQGKVAELEKLLGKSPCEGKIGIAHTRWATHGIPSEVNAHPHTSNDTLAIVHNGIIENHESLKQNLLKKGYQFQSETDTEIIAHLLHYFLQKESDILSAIQKTYEKLEGAFALGIIFRNQPEHLFAVRKGSPLVIGLGFNENFIASDTLALAPVTHKFIYLEDGDIAELTTKKVKIIDAKGDVVKRHIHNSNVKHASINRGEYRHFMQKEIFEQSQAIAATLEGRLSKNKILEAAFGHKSSAIFDKTKHVVIIACGTSYHAGLIARYWIEEIAGISCQVEVASEYRYRHAAVLPNTLFVTISQSGETADTLAALRLAKQQNYLATLAICNVAESSLVRETDLVLMTHAGTEIGVASTKAFTTQLSALLMLTIILARRNSVKGFDEKALITDLISLPRLITDVLKTDKQIKSLAKYFNDKNHALFLGRGAQYPVAMEGALKLKEISYIHAEAYPAGELKHGPLALVDKEMPVIAIAPNDELIEKLKSNLQEVQARGGQLFIFADKKAQISKTNGENIIVIPSVSKLIAPIIYTIPLQLLAYHVAVLKGTDVDQPRNLAKSVTVE